MTKDQVFNKVWRVRNIGTCTWNTKYTIIFSSGDKMNGATSSVPEQVSPGEQVDLTVTMKSPEKTGTYDGNWIIKSEKGTKFGIGTNADQPLTVSIEVVKGSGSIYYDFGANYCAATWSTKDNDQLPCPGKENDSDGFVILLPEPALESRNENEPALWTQPPDADGAYITGEYPKIKVSSGDRFLADVGCLKDQKKCDVIFRLRYQIGDDDPVDLGHWDETYDGDITRIDVDLSALDGKSVKFILMVKVNDNPQDAAGFWLVPRLIR